MSIFRTVALLSLSFTLCYCSQEKKPNTSGKTETTEAAASQPGFTITGTASGISDSTWVFIESAITDSLTKPLDSAMVLDGHFELAGHLKEDAVPAMLRTKNFSDYTFLWLENKNLTFKGRKGEFSTAAVSGSGMQLENNRLDSLIAPIRISQDSINLALLNEKADKKTLASRLNILNEKEKQAYITFIRNNPNSLVSAYLLSVHQKAWGKETTTQLYSILSAGNKNSSFGKAVSN